MDSKAETNSKTNSRESEKDYRYYRKVSRWPDWLMAIFGFFASFLGTKGCDSIFYKLKGRLAAIEEIEVQEAENSTYKFRKRATELITGVLNQNGSSGRHVTPRRKMSYLTTLADVKADLNFKTEELEQQIMKTRNLADAKLSAYLAGIHRGLLRSYEYPEPLYTESQALEQYYDSLSELMELIEHTLGGNRNEKH